MPRPRPISHGSRETLRATFESVADGYHQARPSYPTALLDPLVDLAALRSGDRLLEVGCGTGKRRSRWRSEGFVYDADSYLALVDTFSGHITMQAWQRERLHEEIRSRLAQRPDGRLRRHWGAALHVARRAAQ